MTLLEQLRCYGESGACPMHMPGHKRADLGGPLPWGLDITEIDGFDNLHDAQGILKEGMDRAARLYGSDRAFYLVNGSTCGILAGVCAVARPGDTVLVSRGCHKSVYHALELRELVPVYLTAPLDPASGVTASLPPQAVADALAAHPEARLLIVTSPTYEGVCSDLDTIVALAHSAGVPVLVDAAHGAHLGFSPAFSGGAISSGADIVIQSLHKTLPSLTQTSLAHWNHGLVDADEFARQLSIFETSSPSYLLMGSIDQCVDLLERQGPELFAAYENNLSAFDRAVAGLGHLRVLCHGGDRLADHPGFFAFDPGKLVISTRGTDLTGPALMERLRREDHIELEMAMGDYALAMTSICDTEESLERLAAALLRIDSSLHSAAAAAPPAALPLPERRLLIGQARRLPGEAVPLAEAVGQVSGGMVWAYPPGVPLLVPGEVLSAELAAALRDFPARGVCLHGEHSCPPETVWVLKNCGV